ncbi:GntR family transcriptional regulator [Cucumibacter marinus]|uniref:GntR family transcriptional regulator n=1 Tax=Cucumibacter marinus TaxID=1121252 RepID=UPI00055D5BD0|nr:FCD domain-containing protein [Cucumibacter marinus]
MAAVELGNSAEPQTQAARVFDQMRADILSCRLMPNERLRMEALRARYDTGTSPIREALMRLHAEGHVVLEQNKGFRVTPVSHATLIDLTRTRIEIEQIALRWSIENGDVEWEANLLGAFHRLSRQPKTDPDKPGEINEAWRREHRTFHNALVAACGSPTIMNIRSGLYDQAERYVALSVTSSIKARDDVAEHELLMNTALERDTPGAMDAIRAHFSATTDKVALTVAADGQIAGADKEVVS